MDTEAETKGRKSRKRNHIKTEQEADEITTNDQDCSKPKRSGRKKQAISYQEDGDEPKPSKKSTNSKEKKSRKKNTETEIKQESITPDVSTTKETKTRKKGKTKEVDENGKESDDDALQDAKEKGKGKTRTNKRKTEPQEKDSVTPVPKGKGKTKKVKVDAADDTKVSKKTKAGKAKKQKEEDKENQDYGHQGHNGIKLDAAAPLNSTYVLEDDGLTEDIGKKSEMVDDGQNVVDTTKTSIISSAQEECLSDDDEQTRPNDNVNDALQEGLDPQDNPAVETETENRQSLEISDPANPLRNNAENNLSTASVTYTANSGNQESNAELKTVVHQAVASRENMRNHLRDNLLQTTECLQIIDQQVTSLLEKLYTGLREEMQELQKVNETNEVPVEGQETTEVPVEGNESKVPAEGNETVVVPAEGNETIEVPVKGKETTEAPVEEGDANEVQQGTHEEMDILWEENQNQKKTIRSLHEELYTVRNDFQTKTGKYKKAFLRLIGGHGQIVLASDLHTQRLGALSIDEICDLVLNQGSE